MNRFFSPMRALPHSAPASQHARAALALAMLSVASAAAISKQAATAAPAQPAAKAVLGAAQLLPAQSHIRFTARQMGVPMQGAFQRYSAQLQFAPAQLAHSRLLLLVDTASVSIGQAEFDAELQSPEWFDSKRQPQARFEATQFQAGKAPGSYTVQGRFTLKGKSQLLSVPVQLRQQMQGGQRISLVNGAFQLPRSAYGIGTGAWADTSVVGDAVQVQFQFAFSGIAPL